MRRAFLFLLAASIAGSASCLDPTEVVIEITTDMPCGPGDTGPRLLKTRISTGPNGSNLAERASTMKCHAPANGSTTVGTFVLVPGTSNEVFVEVQGDVLGEALPLSTTRIIRYIPHTKLGLEIDLSSACLRKMCPVGETCSRGMCMGQMVEGCKGGSCLDAGEDATMPLKDASDDAILPMKDSAPDAPILGNDGGPFDASLDSGVTCPVPPFTPALYWPFNEQPGGQTQEKIYKQTSTLYGGAKIAQGMGPCGNVLSLPAVNASSTLLGCPGGQLSCWPGSSSLYLMLAVAGQGPGAIARHGTGKAGSWLLEVLQNQLVQFTLITSTNTGQVSAGSITNIGQVVIAKFTNGALSLQVGNSPAGIANLAGTIPMESGYDVVIPSPDAGNTFKGAIDELFVGWQ